MIGEFYRTGNCKERICVQTEWVNLPYLLRVHSWCLGKRCLIHSIGQTQFGHADRYLVLRRRIPVWVHTGAIDRYECSRRDGTSL